MGPVVYTVVKRAEGQFEYLHLCEMCKREMVFHDVNNALFDDMPRKNYRTTDEGGECAAITCEGIARSRELRRRELFVQN